jgi:hypothetical protein
MLWPNPDEKQVLHKRSVEGIILMSAVYFLSRAKRAILHRLNLRKALQCALQRRRETVKFIGIGYNPRWKAFYASFEHFQHDIPAIWPRRQYRYLVAQSFLDEFIAERRPKVYFSREPMAHFSEQSLLTMTRKDLAPFIIRFGEEDIERRMFYVALPDRKNRIIKRLQGSMNRKRPRLCCIVNRYNNLDYLPLLKQRINFVQAMGDDIDIFGRAPLYNANMWENYPNYRGAARDKIKTLSHYNFNLCFENCDEDGYITEKIIHALMAGCVPLYWGGGRFLEQTIPSSCFINCKEEDPFEVYQRILAMPQDEIVRYRQAGLEFIASTEADRYSWNYWANTVTQRFREIS